MCGIVGFYSKIENKESILKEQLSTLNHRGPDDEGCFIDDRVALGHKRLAIIDIEGAKQPMSSNDDRYVLIFNGEIYNYLELRQDLIAKGYKFKTFSDTEVLLNIYIEYKEKCLTKLNGMFAFAVYDKKKQELFLARDHFGIKPLYYTNVENGFVFASEVKAILKYPNIQAKLDEPSLHEYITFQLMLGENTLFKDISSLEPANYMIVKEGRVVKKQQYWELNYDIDNTHSEEYFLSEIQHILDHSVNIQTRSDVKVGAYLSGGIDSSIVATFAAKNYDSRLYTFSGAFKDGPEYDETFYSDLVSKNINSIHNVIYPTHNDFIDNFENIIYHMDYPEAGSGVFSQYMVSKLAKEHVTVVLGGHGGDEIFGGYTRYLVAYLEQALKGAIFETQEESEYVVTLQSIIPNLSQLQGYVPMMKSHFSTGIFEDIDKSYFKLVNRSLNANKLYELDILSEQDKLFSKFQSIFNNPNIKSLFNKMTYFDLKTLIPALLHVEDRVSMAHSLESRVPILDYRLVELASQINPIMKFEGGKTKYMLIEAIKNFLPQEVINRKDKMGFPTPINKWLSNELKDYAHDTLLSQKARERGIYNPKEVENMLVNSGKFNRDLWGILSLEVWFRSFIDG